MACALADYRNGPGKSARAYALRPYMVGNNLVDKRLIADC
jgi:hypothetical protein